MRFRRLVLVSAVTICALAAEASERVAGKRIADTFAGMTLDGVYEDGTFFTETYFEDGTIRYHDVNRSDSGQWSVRGETFCTFYEDQAGACFFVESDGANCFTFFEAVEDSEGKSSPNREWTSRGWDRAHPATCATPPEAEI